MSSLKAVELTNLLNTVLKDTGHLRKGNNLTYHCPKCHHHKQKFEVCLDEPHKWNCWVCNFHGRGMRNLFLSLGASPRTLSILDKLVETKVSTYQPNLSLKDRILLRFGEKSPSHEQVLYLPPFFKSLADDDGSIDYKIARKKARERRLTFCDIIKYNIGYCTKGEYANRLVFPSYDANNNLNFYSCRNYSDEGLKYKNSEFSKNIIGFENLVDFDFPIYLTEGALDAIATRRNAIPLFGKTLSPKLKHAITKSNCPEVNVILDDDALRSAIRIAEWVHGAGKVVKVVRLSGHDPNRIGFIQTLAHIKETDVLDFSALLRLKLE